MDNSEDNPYRESQPERTAPPSSERQEKPDDEGPTTQSFGGRDDDDAPIQRDTPRGEGDPSLNGSGDASAGQNAQGQGGGGGERFQRRDRGDRFERNGRGRHRRHRGRGRRGGGGGRSDGGHRGGQDGGHRGGQEGGYEGGQRNEPQTPVVLTPVGDSQGWFDPNREGGFIRKAAASYRAEPGDAWISPQLVRQWAIKKGDHVNALVGRDPRGRVSAMEVQTINGGDPALSLKRQDFQSLTAAYPERKLYLETGKPVKGMGGHELTRRAIDLIAPIGYGQRALIVAPARAGKTTLLHAITEGIVINHPDAVLLILLVDERPEEMTEAISWGVGEVIASTFDQPAQRHVEVVEMVMEHARRLVEMGKDVIIVLDSLTRMARAHNTAERGTGRTMSGGLDATAMAKPKAFFGSARAIPESAGGGSLTIISTALVETGSRMDDVIFEEFKGTGNSELKLDRSLADKRIYPAIDVATSGTRREEKLFKPEQLEAVHALRRGLAQMPPQSAMEWLIKRIAATSSNDALLAGLL